MDDSKVIERIKKLRAVAERATFEGEATAANNRADRLMAKYGITEEQLNPPRRSDPLHDLRVANADSQNRGTPMDINLVDDMVQRFIRGDIFTPQQAAANFSDSVIYINGVRVQ